MGRPKSNNVQINISIPMEWKTQLDLSLETAIPFFTTILLIGYSFSHKPQPIHFRELIFNLFVYV